MNEKTKSESSAREAEKQASINLAAEFIKDYDFDFLLARMGEAEKLRDSQELPNGWIIIVEQGEETEDEKLESIFMNAKEAKKIAKSLVEAGQPRSIKVRIVGEYDIGDFDEDNKYIIRISIRPIIRAIK